MHVVGRKKGIDEPKPRPVGGGRKARETWAERYERDTDGVTLISVQLPHELGAWLETETENGKTTIPRLIVEIVREAMQAAKEAK